MKKIEEIVKLKKALIEIENLHSSFEYLKIGVASSEQIKNWAEKKLPNGEIIGEVLTAETINFRDNKPEAYGLFCEKIFGPIKNWKCKCGKYSGFLLNKICEQCFVELIESRVRRYRMGYIELVSPITHNWYLKGIPNYILTLLRCIDANITSTELDQIVYFKEGKRILSESPLSVFFYLNKKDLRHKLKQIKNLNILSSTTYYEGKENLAKKKILRNGSELIQTLLESINLKQHILSLRFCILKNQNLNNENLTFQDKNLLKRLRVLESFLATKTNPSWLVLTSLPVLPPTLRPIFSLENGKSIAADLNEFYRLIIIRNQRLFDFMHTYSFPNLITTHAKKLLQEVIDGLIDNSRLAKEKIFLLNNNPLKSLTEILESKQGRFRQSLLGKRVDYSARSVIIVDPQLKLNQCGLPYEISAELFQPILIHELLKTKENLFKNNIKFAQDILKNNKLIVWRLLNDLIKNYTVLLNRAPTLHKFGIQSFNPILVLGQAIHLHPLVCSGFNADFDGDQMAVHLPLYEVSQLEVKTLLRPCNNILSSSNGEVILKPTQDMVIGCYYLTVMLRRKFNYKYVFTENEALIAHFQKKITLHQNILVKYSLLSDDLKLENKKLIFKKINNNFININRNLSILKIYKVKNSYYKYNLLTNIGIFVAYSKNKKNYIFTELFFETTPGRIIFSTNFNKILKI